MDKCPRDLSIYQRSVDNDHVAVIVVVAANAAVLLLIFTKIDIRHLFHLRANPGDVLER